MPTRSFNGPYSGEHLSRIGFPLGGLGAGMLCLEGSGALSQVSLRHRPEVAHAPLIFAALSLRTATPLARVLEGPVPTRKLYGAGHGVEQPLGLPRFRDTELLVRFPFARLELSDAAVPVSVTLTAWSPFVPNDADASSLPVAALEYELVNTGPDRLKGVFSFHAGCVSVS